MKVKSIIQRKNGHTVRMEGEEYAFTPDEDYICEVSDKTHLARFLAIQEGFELADEKQSPEDVVAIIPDDKPVDYPQLDDAKPTQDEAAPPVKKAAVKKAAVKKAVSAGTPRNRK